MYIELDYTSDTYLYQQIYSKIKKLIIKRELTNGDKLPSIRNMSIEHQISINTVKKAYYQLETEGYISCKEKSGFFVNKIDYLLSITPENEKEINDQDIKEYKYDFGFSGVDSEHFPYYLMSKIFKETISQCSFDTVNKRQSQGNLNLRTAIKNYLKSSRGISCNEENIIVSAGTENLFFILRKILGPQAIFGFEDPGYPWGIPYFTSELENPISLKMDKNGITIEDLEKHKVTACIITPAHQFPTGKVMPITRRVQLLNWSLLENDRYIIEDDYDGEFKYKGQVIPAIKSLKNSHKVIYMGNFSKSLSPTIKISYMVLPQNLLNIYKEQFQGFSCPVSSFIQEAITEFITQGYFEKHINTMRNIYHKKQQIIKKYISKAKNIKVQYSRSGTSIIIEIPDINQDILIKKLEENSIKIYPVSRFTSKEDKYKDFYILGYGPVKSEDLKEGIEKLIDTVDKIKKTCKNNKKM